jgi:L-ascorbate metabolism protein UlaG (beta-lactamase superfamily)
VPTNEKVYLRQNVQVEPLFCGWSAWIHLIPPAAAALNISERYLPIMRSYVTSPQMHAAALKNPAMKGGPFIDLGGKRVEEVRELIRVTSERFPGLVELGKALKQWSATLAQKAKGMALEPLYTEVPEALKGYVELCYDVNHSPTFRVIEPLLYRSRFYAENAQEVALSLVTRDKERPFIMSTPRLPDPSTLFLRTPFRSPALDQLFRMKTEAGTVGAVSEQFGVDAAGVFGSFFTTDAPPRPEPFAGEGVRIRYFGHACVLVETKDVRILVDPVVSYQYSNSLPRYTFADLPDEIDYALITHSHHDHILLETLLQLRHKVKNIVVGRNLDGILHDPSLALALEKTGFPQVREVRDMTEIPISGGAITAIPFLGEHHDLLMQSKNAYMVRIGESRILFLADSCNPDSALFAHVFAETGTPQVLFLGMECEGAPPSWLYGVFFPQPMARDIDRSRRSRGSTYEEAAALVDRFPVEQVYVYAMGQEPWLSHILDNALNEESESTKQTRKLIAHCEGKGITAQNLYAQKEIRIG